MEVEVRNGVPHIWEEGGGLTNSGAVTLVAAPDGSPKVPVEVRRTGHLACEKHALIPVEPGDLVIEGWRSRDEFRIQVSRFGDQIEVLATYISVWKGGGWDDRWEGEWVKTAPDMALAATDAAAEKLFHYHCRCPHWVKA